MPFSSSLFKFISDSQQELDNSKDGRSYGGGSSVVSSRRSSNSSFEFVNCNNEQPLLSEREAIKIKARCAINGNIEMKSMTVDPNITSFASIYLLLKKAFSLSNDFDISYLLPKSVENTTRPDIFLSLSSDWDLDAAFHTASYPWLEIRVIPVVKGDVADWHVLEPIDAPPVKDIKSNYLQLPLTVSLRHEVSKKFNKVLDVFVDPNKRTPLSEKEWTNYFDGNGRVMSPKDFRIRVFHGGLEPGLRREAWVHLLGVYPSDLSVEERTRFLFIKTQVYKHLKENWQARNPQEIEPVTHMVHKDVLRTDRTHHFFNVPEDHPNILSLYNILTTFALNNPEISYCQGMSDLAAPLLVVTEDETMAYLCFCKVMQRLRCNFLLKGTALLQKFGQLSLLLQRTDENFYKYLQDIDGGNLYFCYRMLLLELKREFPFVEALRVMEIIWSSIPPDSDEESELSFYYALLQSDKTASNGRVSPAVEGLFKPNYSCDNSIEEDFVKLEPLPHPRYLNDGSPFPLFLCLAILLINRDHVLNNQMDYAMLAMFFDKLSRKHDSAKILSKARNLYFEYIKAYLDGQTVNPNEKERKTMESAHGTSSIAAQC